MELLLYGELSQGYNGDQGRVLIQSADMGMNAQGVGGVVGPKYPSRDNAWVHDQCSVQGSTGDIPLNPSIKVNFSFLIHWVVSKLLSSYTMLPLCNHLAPTALGSASPCDSRVTIHVRASLAFVTSSHSVSSLMWLGSVDGSVSIDTCLSLTLDLVRVLRCKAGSWLFNASAYVVYVRPSSWWWVASLALPLADLTAASISLLMLLWRLSVIFCMSSFAVSIPCCSLSLISSPVCTASPLLVWCH